MWRQIAGGAFSSIALLSLECAAQVPSFRGTGAELLNACRDAESFRDGTSAFSQGFCYGAVLAAADMLHGREFCFPEAGLPNIQLLRIVIRYIEDNPSKQHLRLSALAAAAYKQAFPCSKEEPRR
jgi:hypothetical protein